MLFRCRLLTRQKLAAIFALALFGASSAFAQVRGAVETRLPNGLTVLMKENHTAPVFTAQVWFRVGSRNEHTGITGVSHLLEHMLFNSSKNFKKGEITRLIRSKGGLENAATWTDFTYYWQLLSSEHLELSLKTLAERVGNALLLESELEKERTVVLSELQGRENDPGWLLYHGMLATAFQAHPYQWSVIGWRSDVENVTRKQLVDYYRTYYHPNNATLVLVGDFDSAKALRLIKRYFSGKPPAKLPREPHTSEPVQRGKREFNLNLEGTAARVLLGYHAPPLTHPDAYALMVLAQVLSGGRSSRLYQALVESGLATSAWSNADLRRDPGLFTLGATARQGIPPTEIEQVLLREVNKISECAVTDEEIIAAKNQLEAYFIFQNDSVSDQGKQLGYYNTVASWRYLQTLIPRIRSVTPGKILAVARKYLIEDNLTVARFIPKSQTMTHSVGIRATSEETQAKLAAQDRPHQLEKSHIARQLLSEKEQKVYSPVPAKFATQHAPIENRFDPYRTVLPNGIVVILLENHSNPTIAVAGCLKAGSYFDPSGKRGLAELVAETITRGTHKRNALDIAREIDSIGASLDTSCSVESMEFSARCLAKDFPLVLDILADMLKNPSFPNDQFEKAKDEMLSRLLQIKESPAAQASRAFYNAAYPSDHPCHALTLDEAATNLSAIQREDLIAFHKSYYRPETTIVVIVGDVNTKEAIDLMNRYFGDWSAEGPTPLMYIPDLDPPQRPVTVTVPMADKSETRILYGHPLNLRRTDPDYYAVRIMNQILGGSGALASLLGQEIREKRGLAYDVYSTFDATLAPGPWYVALGTSPKNVNQVVKILRDTISSFKLKGPTRQQFDQAREFLIGVFPIALETNAGMAHALMNAEFYGLGLDYLKNYAKIYRSVTLEQVKAAAVKYLAPDKAILVKAGPVNSK